MYTSHPSAFSPLNTLGNSISSSMSLFSTKYCKLFDYILLLRVRASRTLFPDDKVEQESKEKILWDNNRFCTNGSQMEGEGRIKPGPTETHCVINSAPAKNGRKLSGAMKKMLRILFHPHWSFIRTCFKVKARKIRPRCQISTLLTETEIYEFQSQHRITLFSLSLLSKNK